MGSFSKCWRHIPKHFSYLNVWFSRYCEKFIAKASLYLKIFLILWTKIGSKVRKVNFFKFHLHYQKHYLIIHWGKLYYNWSNFSFWYRIVLSRCQKLKFHLHYQKQHYLIHHCVNFHQNWSTSFGTKFGLSGVRKSKFSNFNRAISVI